MYMELSFMQALGLALRDLLLGLGQSLLVYGIVWLVTLVGVVLAVGITLRILRRRQILDQPNQRSLHQVPTPRGGGLGVIAGISPIIIAFIYYAVRSANNGAAHLAVSLGIGLYLLTLVSFIDDRRSLSPTVRLVVQALCSFWLLAAIPPELTVSGGLAPLWLERLILLLALMWFINLYNFMDGIDGITAIETISIGLGGFLSLIIPALLLVVLPHYFSVTMPDIFAHPESTLLQFIVPILSMVLLAAGVGFSFYNWSPARIFLGDSGSIPLGYLSGFLLICLLLQGWWQTAILLPLYYLMDASLTLIHRLKRGEKLWQAHRLHFYQRAVQGGLNHAQVARKILWVNLGLIAFSCSSPFVPYGLALAAGLILVVWRLWRFDRLSPIGERFLQSPDDLTPALNKVSNRRSKS